MNAKMGVLSVSIIWVIVFAFFCTWAWILLRQQGRTAQEKGRTKHASAVTGEPHAHLSRRARKMVHRKSRGIPGDGPIRRFKVKVEFPFKTAILSVVTSLLILVGFFAYSRWAPRQRNADSNHQSAGEAANLNQQTGAQKKENETFLKGGVLQRGLDSADPQEFITIETSEHLPQYTSQSPSVHAGAVVSVTLRNYSKVNQAHDWVLVRPGSRDRVQVLAMNATNLWGWIPDTADVLAFVPMTQPGDSTTLLFRAPSEPGDYPFLCTFPGHGMAMNGTLHVLASS